MAGNVFMVFFKHFEPVELFLVRRVCFSMLLAPIFEEIGGGRR